MVRRQLCPKEFIRLLVICNDNNSSGQNLNMTLRFFLHYSQETISYVQYVLPKLNINDIKILTKFYGMNKKEMGERFIWPQFLESIAKRSLELFNSTDFTNQSDVKPFFSIIHAFSYILFRTESVCKLFS